MNQGDPLSPALFILSAEVLTRALNDLIDGTQYIGYGLPEWSPNLIHLAFVDDTIIFSSTNGYSLWKIIGILQEYEKISIWKVNKENSCYYLHQNILGNTSIEVEHHIGIIRGSFPMKHLGCPTTYEEKMKIRLYRFDL